MIKSLKEYQNYKKNRKKLYRIENNKHVSRLEEEEIRQYLTKLEKSVNKFKKYYDHDDLDYKGIRDIENLFDEADEVDYYKPVKNNNDDLDYKRIRDRKFI